MHSEFTLLMSMVLDDEASVDELARLRAHLADCAECRSVWANWQEMDRRMLAAPRLEAPMGLADRIEARLAERELQRRRLKWLGSGLALGWLGLLGLSLLIATGLSTWLNGNLQEVGALASTAAQVLTVLSGLLRGVTTAVNSLGAPVLAALAGGLACLICALAMMWLWLAGRSDAFQHVPTSRD